MCITSRHTTNWFQHILIYVGRLPHTRLPERRVSPGHAATEVLWPQREWGSDSEGDHPGLWKDLAQALRSFSGDGEPVHQPNHPWAVGGFPPRVTPQLPLPGPSDDLLSCKCGVVGTRGIRSEHVDSDKAFPGFQKAALCSSLMLHLDL